jgi:hypothetical protein
VVVSKFIEKNCYIISEHTCYEVLKDFSSPILTILAVMFSVFFAFRQLSKQHGNTILAQKEEAKRNTKIELFKDISQLLEQSSAVVREINTYCDAKKYNPTAVALIDHQEYSELSHKLNVALLIVVSKIESNEIVHPQLFKTFRFSLQSIVHDVMQLRKDTTSTTCLDKMMDYTSDASCYLADFQVCMQNLAYGDTFGTKVLARIPVDKRLKVIEDDPVKLDSLLKYFEHESNWGVSCAKYQKEAEEHFSS